MISVNQSSDILYEETNIRKCKDSLIAAAKAAGCHDNVTVILCDVVSGAGKYIPITSELDNDNIVDKPRSKSQRVWMIIIGILLIIGLIVLAFFAGLRYSHYQNDPIDDQQLTDSVAIDEIINEGAIEEEKTIKPMQVNEIVERSIHNQRNTPNNTSNTSTENNIETPDAVDPSEQEPKGSITTIEENKPTPQEEEVKTGDDKQESDKKEEPDQKQEEVESPDSSPATVIPSNDQ